MLSGAFLHVANGIIIQLSSKTEEREQLVGTATPEFGPRTKPFKPILKEDVFYTAPKRVNPLKVEAVEMKSNEIHQILEKKKISFCLWEDVSRWTFLLMNRRCLVGLVSTITHDDNHLRKCFICQALLNRSQKWAQPKKFCVNPKKKLKDWKIRKLASSLTMRYTAKRWK